MAQEHRFKPRSAARMRRLMNLWPPLLFAGIRVVAWDDDYRRVVVRLGRPNALTGNAFGTQFGGSLFAMTDPWFSIMLGHHLGRDYAVWDQSAEIDFVSPGRTAVTAVFVLTAEEVAEVRTLAATGEKVLRRLDAEVVGIDGTVVARVRKELYIRRKRDVGRSA